MRTPIAAARSYLGMFDRRLHLLAMGQLMNALGRGMAMPFLALYFTTVRGFPLAVAASGFAASSVTSIAFGLTAGAVADRFGRKPVMAASLGLGGLAMLGFMLVETRAQYLAASAVSGAAFALYGPAARAMVADVTPRERRGRAYGLLYMTTNLGFGIGVATGGLVAALSFVAVFLIAAIGSLIYFVVLLVAVRESAPPRAAARSVGESVAALLDWRRPLTHRPFLVFVSVDLLFSLVWSLFNSILPVYVGTTLGLGTVHVGIVLATNAALVVLLQIPASALADRQPRTRLLTLAAIALAASYLVFWSAGRLAPPGAVFAVMLLGMVVMTVSEMLRSPVQPAFVADLAGGRDVGKHMSFLDVSHALGWAIGPLVAAALYDAGRPHLVWPTFAALMLPAIFGLFLLRVRFLTREMDDPRHARG